MWLDNQLKHYSALVDQYEDNRRIRHDIAHHMHTIQLLLESGRRQEATAYAGELMRQQEHSSQLDQCENPLVDAFLFSRIREARQAGIPVEASVVLPRRLPIANVDLVILFGNLMDNAVEACGQKSLPAGVEIKDAKEVVEIADDPAMAFKQKPDSSLTVGLNLLKDGAGDAFVSAGSTGALLSGATLVVKRIRGIRRAAMGPQIPTAGGRAVLCDCGANAECTPEYLLQFAYLGSYYAQRVMGIEKPRVGLLNIGAEEEKGDTLRHETYALLKEAGEAGRIHFIGNVEANEAMMGTADVIVTDGFTGNVMLKTMEGVGKFLLKSLKEMFLSSTKTKLAAGLVKGDLGQMKKLLDPSEVGGTPFLGIQKPVIKAHGGSNARAIENAVLRAKEYAESGFIADIQANIEHMRVQPGMEKN